VSVAAGDRWRGGRKRQESCVPSCRYARRHTSRRAADFAGCPQRRRESAAAVAAGRVKQAKEECRTILPPGARRMPAVPRPSRDRYSVAPQQRGGSAGMARRRGAKAAAVAASPAAAAGSYFPASKPQQAVQRQYSGLLSSRFEYSGPIRHGRACAAGRPPPRRPEQAPAWQAPKERSRYRGENSTDTPAKPHARCRAPCRNSPREPASPFAAQNALKSP